MNEEPKTPLSREDVVEPFSVDALQNRGYRYTTNAPLSSQYANDRITAAMLAQINFNAKQVVDIGCGDGAYTIELFDRGQPKKMAGIDPSAEAIEIALTKKGPRNIEFSSASAYHLPWRDNFFDVAYFRGVLHHMERPMDGLREAFRVAPVVLVMEPNGYNPVLKVLEKVSPYHVEHEEKSYTARTLESWITAIGGTVTRSEWIGLVPMFCPSWLARVLKIIEPIVERLPLINRLCCAQCVFAARRR